MSKTEAFATFYLSSVGVNTNFLSGYTYSNASDFAFSREILISTFEFRRPVIALNVSYAILRSRVLQAVRFFKVRLIRLKRLVLK